MEHDRPCKLKFRKGVSKPGVEQYLWDGGPFTAVKYVYEPGSSFPSHDHASAQLSVVLSGRINFQVEGEEFELESGDSIYIPGGLRHSAEVPANNGPVTSLNIFHPPRKDHP